MYELYLWCIQTGYLIINYRCAHTAITFLLMEMVCLSGLRLQLKGARAQYGTYGDCGMWFPPPGFAFETMQPYTVSPPQWESPLLSVTALNNGVTLLFLVKYESMYIYVKWQQDFHFEGRHCHVLSASGLLKMEQGDKWERKRTRCEKKEKNIQSCKYVTTVSLKKTFSSKPQQCSLCE